MQMTILKNHTGLRVLLASAGSLSLGLLSGCATGTSSTAAGPVLTHGAAIRGAVHGGQQPVAGATIQLYAAGTAGYGSAATPLIAGSVTTDSNGGFNVTGAYTCPSTSAPIYLVATGGNSGFSVNNSLALMVALGPCGSVTDSTFVQINELTTVAAAYALAPFSSAGTHSYTSIGSTASNQAGLANAMTDSNILANPATGTTPGTAVAGLTVPVAEVNTLANIIASCVNSSGGAAGDSTSCGTLFANANPGGTAPTDTITALTDIAQHPAGSTANETALYNLSTAAAPFQPTLAAQPTDFSLAVTLAGGSMNAPAGLALDSAGNVWVANAAGNTVTEFDHNGNTLSGTGFTASLNAPSAIALASDGTVWVTNRGNNSVSRLSAAGGPVAGSPYTGGGLNLPRSIAFDARGTAWIANGGSNSVTTITSSGAAPTLYTPAAASNPLAIAVNPH